MRLLAYDNAGGPELAQPSLTPWSKRLGHCNLGHLEPPGEGTHFLWFLRQNEL
jgi:hypothetical protein